MVRVQNRLSNFQILKTRFSFWSYLFVYKGACPMRLLCSTEKVWIEDECVDMKGVILNKNTK